MYYLHWNTNYLVYVYLMRYYKGSSKEMLQYN